MRRALAVTLLTLVALAPTLSGKVPTTSAQQPDHLANVRTLYDDVWNGQDLTLIDQLFTPDHVYHDPSTPGIGGGPAGYRQLVQLYTGAFPDVHFRVDDVVAEADEVAVRWTATGTQGGELNGLPATGRAISITAMAIYRFAGDQVAETWVIYDALGLVTQLTTGEAPATDATPVPADERFATPAADDDPGAGAELAQRLYEDVWNANDPAALSDLVTADYRYVDPSVPPLPPGADAYGALVTGFHAGLPDLVITIEDTVADGDTVAIRWSATGTQTGEFMGIPATGTEITTEALTFLTIDDGKIATNWSVFDALGLLTQLGAFPPPASATPTA